VRRDAGTRVLTVAAAGAAAAFTLLAVAVAVRGGAPFPLDTDLHRWAVAHRTAALTAAARAVTDTGTGAIAYALAAVAGVLGGGRRRWWAGALVAVGTLALCEAVRWGVSVAIGRVRPPQADWATVAGGFAFPSGHTTTSAVVAALFCAAVTLQVPARPWRAAARTGAVAWAAAVGLSRVYLGVHWPTDVAGGWLLAVTLTGAAWLLARRRLGGAARPGAG
jgi:undecaprenyl-diphosphatase